MSIDFTSIAYLENGNERQKNLYRLLTSYKIIEQLQAFDPIVVGTIPIDIALESSDVDIILYTENPELLVAVLNNYFSKWNDFHIERKEGADQSVVCNFIIEDIPFELYATAIPTDQQAGYIHMLKEHEILCRENSEFRKKIMELKQQGIKTEPAFCLLLGLITDDPYQKLLEFNVDTYYR